MVTDFDREILKDWLTRNKPISVRTKKKYYRYEQEYYEPKEVVSGHEWIKKSKWRNK